MRVKTGFINRISLSLFNQHEQNRKRKKREEEEKEKNEHKNIQQR